MQFDGHGDPSGIGWRIRAVGTRPKLVGLGVLAVLLAGVIALVHGIGSSPGGGSDGGSVSSVGCPISPISGAPAGVTFVDPICTEGAVVVRYCGVSPDDLRVPQMLGQSFRPSNDPQFLARIDMFFSPSTNDQVLVESFTDPSRSVAWSVNCGGSLANGAVISFTAAQWAVFTSPGDGSNFPPGCLILCGVGSSVGASPSPLASDQDRTGVDGSGAPTTVEAPPSATPAPSDPSQACPPYSGDPIPALTRGVAAVLDAWRTGDFTQVDGCDQGGSGLAGYFTGHAYVTGTTTVCRDAKVEHSDTGAKEYDCVVRREDGSFLLRVSYGVGDGGEYIDDISFTTAAPVAG